jgi:hypothetical protein
MTNRRAPTEVKGEGPNLSGLDSLVSSARSSEDHEAYQAIATSEHFRIGLVASTAPDMLISFRIEALVQVLTKDTQHLVADLERTNKVLESLAGRGYSLGHHGSCWVSCELDVMIDDIEKECLAVMEIMRWMTVAETGIRDDKG